MRRLLLQCRNLGRITYLELLWGLRIPESVVYTFLAPALVLLLLGLMRGSKEYLHVLVPGVIATTVASSAMQGVGTTASFMRAYGSWRTLQASPIPTWLYLAGLVCSRVVRTLLVACLMLLVAYLLLGCRMQGSVALILVYVLAGTLVFSSLGLVISYIVPSPSAVPGMMNLILLPMIFTSGALFITNIEWVKNIANLFPLTFLVALIRDNAKSGGLGENWLFNVGALAGWFVLCSWMALALARRRVEER
jgi:ABC-2 type transport system permease protein